MLSEHLPLIASAPEGIQKLRRLILELAVRGKLLPQDPKDEPASELLKRIRQERSQLDGAKSRNKIEPPLHAKESPLFELPSSWTWVPFGEIALHNSGKTLDKGRNAGQARDYITTSNLYWGRFELSELKRMLISDDELERCTARKYDLLICEGGEAGRAAVWSFDREVCFQNHVHRARFMGNIDPYFGFRFFEWLNASGEIEHYRKGVGISNMSGKALASIPFTLPPLAEQHRIVAKVDELIALCDRLESEQNDSAAAHTQLVEALLGALTQSTDAADFETNWKRITENFDTLFTTDASIDALQKSILQLAVMGKLVPQDSNDEPASMLLTRIAQHKPAKKHSEILQGSEGSLPIRWMAATLDDFSIEVSTGPFGSALHKSDYIDGGIPLVNPSHMINDRIVVDSRVSVSEENAERLSSYRLAAGDIVMARRGEVGRAALVSEHQTGWLCGTGSFFLRFTDEVNREFLLLVLRSSGMRAYLAGKAVGTTMVNLNHGILKKSPLAIPPLAEQKRIVAKVNAVMTLCESLKARLAVSQKEQSALADSLVKATLAA